MAFKKILISLYFEPLKHLAFRKLTINKRIPIIHFVKLLFKAEADRLKIIDAAS